MLFDMLRTTNSSIKEVYLNKNKQINDECMKSLGEYIKSNKSIEMISLSSNNISDAGIEILAPNIDGNTTFKQFDFGGDYRITDKSIPFLVKMIESSHIENLGVTNTSITQENIIDVCVSLATNTFKDGSTKLGLWERKLQLIINNQFTTITVKYWQ